MEKISPDGESVEALIVERLTEAGLPGHVEDLVVAALLGDSGLEAVLSDGSSARPSLQPEADAAAKPVRTYLGLPVTSAPSSAAELRGWHMTVSQLVADLDARAQASRGSRQATRQKVLPT